jgi:hypothetical protein
MNSTPRPILYIIVIAEAVLAFVGVTALSGTLFYKSYADPAVLSAMIAITSGCVGSLTTLLSNMRQPAPDTTTVSTPSSASAPANVTIDQNKSIANEPEA